VTASVPAIMAIKSHQEPSRAIKSHQEPSRAIKSHQEPSRAIKSHQGPSRAIKGHQGPSRAIRTSEPDKEAQLVRAPACAPLDLASRPLESARLGEQPPRLVLEHIEILCRGEGLQSMQSMAIKGPQRFCSGARASRPTVSNHGNPRQSWQSNAIQGNQGGSASSHLRIGEQPIDSLFHNARHLLRRLHQTDHAAIARDPLWPRVLPHQFPQLLTW